jgi:2-polyprenyl-3-methyl-5-hydroxy-6-metoxy-1,4-benzoquinol methylase
MINTQYELLNEGYDAEVDRFTPNRYRQFFRHLDLNEREKIVLDVGCNSGIGGEVLKLDCVPSNLEKLSSEVYNQKICSDSTNISLDENSVDRIVCGEFIEHLYEEDVLKTLSELFRVLTPGGKLLLTTPNPNYIRLKIEGKSVLGGPHVSEHHPGTLKHKLTDVGFVNPRILGSGKMSNFLGENFPVLSMYGSYLAIVDKSNYRQLN